MSLAQLEGTHCRNHEIVSSNYVTNQIIKTTVEDLSSHSSILGSAL